MVLLVKNGGKHWAAGLATLDSIRYEVRHTRLDLPVLQLLEDVLVHDAAVCERRMTQGVRDRRSATVGK